jgi:hypothetical protein
MDVELYFKVGNRRVSAREFWRHFESEVERLAFEGVERLIREKLRSLRCAEHNKAVTVELSKSRDGSPSFNIHGCCPALVEEATKRLGG